MRSKTMTAGIWDASKIPARKQSTASAIQMAKKLIRQHTPKTDKCPLKHDCINFLKFSSKECRLASSEQSDQKRAFTSQQQVKMKL